MRVRTSLSCSQASVGPRPGALSRSGQEHRAVAHDVCVGQSLDGATQTAGGHGMRVLAERRIGEAGCQSGAADT